MERPDSGLPGWATRPGPAVTSRPRRSLVASWGRSRLAGPCWEYRDYLHNASLQGTHLHVLLTVPRGGGKYAGGLRCCHQFLGGGGPVSPPPPSVLDPARSPPVCVPGGPFPPHAHCQGGASRSTHGDTHTQAHAHRSLEWSPADGPEPHCGESECPSGPPPRPRPLTHSVRPSSAGWAR